MSARAVQASFGPVHPQASDRRQVLSFPRQARSSATAWLVGGTLFLAVMYNPILALINAHVLGLSRSHVVLTEMMIVGAALALIAFQAKRAMLRWIALLVLVVGIGLLLGVANRSFDVKFVRDVLLIPIFIMLGTLFAPFNIVRLMVLIQAIVFAVLILEGAAPGTFGKIFNIILYYVNTRNFAETAFWNPEFALFVSATRPIERFMMGFLDLHRLSSVFLEPVSLGNYVVIITIVIATFWRELSFGQKVFFVLTSAAILVGSDGRLALVTSALVVAGYFIFPRLPLYSNVLFLPLILLAAALWVGLLQIPAAGDDFPGRVAISMDFLGGLSLSEVLGLSQYMSVFYADSGIAYFVATQSIVGVAAIWLFVALGMHQTSRARIYFVNAVCLYISLNLIVSYSLFSIKTGAILWFVYGYLHARTDFPRRLRPVHAGQREKLQGGVAT